MQAKSYDQGREAFQGATLTGGIWLDEEPPDATEDKTPAADAEAAPKTEAEDGA